MESERLETIVLAAVWAAIPILATVLLIVLASRAANGRLQRNQWIGIRGPSTMRSDQAWMVGHRAALRLTPLYLLTTAVMCAALTAAALYASTTNVVMLLGLGGCAVVTALLIYTAYFAARAARSADDHPDGRQRH